MSNSDTAECSLPSFSAAKDMSRALAVITVSLCFESGMEINVPALDTRPNFEVLILEKKVSVVCKKVWSIFSETQNRRDNSYSYLYYLLFLSLNFIVPAGPRNEAKNITRGRLVSAIFLGHPEAGSTTKLIRNIAGSRDLEKYLN